MPELPEVETIRRDLEEVLVGAVVNDIVIEDRTVLREQQRRFQSLRDLRLVALHRRGKHLVLDLGTVQMIIHLRMTGRILPDGHPELPSGEAAQRRRRQFRFRMRTSRGTWVFFDTRRFGTLDIVEGADRWFAGRGLAPDPLTDHEQARDWFVERASGNRAVKTVLLDQALACGVGNIYADEALFRVRLHPLCRVRTLSGTQRGALFDAVVTVMREAIARRGTTTSDYLDVNGNPGVFRRYLNVYRRAGLPCRICGSEIRRIVVSGRGTHFCPVCQAAEIA